jgi:hypothetical protein
LLRRIGGGGLWGGAQWRERERERGRRGQMMQAIKKTQNIVIVYILPCSPAHPPYGLVLLLCNNKSLLNLP